MLLDSHCHLLYPPLGNDVDGVLSRAREAGVAQVVDVGCWPDEADRHRTVELAEARFPEVSAVVGIHPHDARMADDFAVNDVRSLAGRPAVVAIGETGLDYHYDLSPRDEQQKVFRRFIRLARDIGLPLVIHTREAEEDTLRIMQDEGAGEVGGVVHCFTGSMEFARSVLEFGFHIGFTGVITFKGKGTDPLREVARAVHEDRLLLETDSPYLAPVPLRGRPNEPSYIVHTLRKLAELRDTSADRLAMVTASNARRLFGIPTIKQVLRDIP